MGVDASSGSRRRKRVAILGHYGFGNLGDEAVVALLIKKIRECDPSAEICGISLNPRDTEERHGVPALPLRRENEEAGKADAGSEGAAEAPAMRSRRFVARIRRLGGLYATLKATYGALRPICHVPRRILAQMGFLGRSFQRIRGIDLVIVSGSGQLTDHWGGAWSHPYVLLSWSIVARLAGAEVVVLGVGSGQLRTFLGKVFCKAFLRLAKYRSFRDEHSRRAMEGLFLRRNGVVWPDQAFALRDYLDGASAHHTCSRIVGLNVVSRNFYVRRPEDEALHSNYILNMARLCLWLFERGYTISFCPSHLFHDPPVVRAILEKAKALAESRPDIGEWPGRIIDAPIRGLDDLIARVSDVDLVIASRFHGVVIPFVLHKPVISISYARKNDDLMERMGQERFAMRLKGFDFDELTRRVEDIEQRRAEIVEVLEARALECAESLGRQYEYIFKRFL